MTYDRTLLASTKSIGEDLEVLGEGPTATLGSVPHSTLEPFEAVTAAACSNSAAFQLQGRDLSRASTVLLDWHGRLPGGSPYAALVDFYDDAW